MFANNYDHAFRSRSRAAQPGGLDVGQWEYELSELVKIFKWHAPLVTVELGVWQGGTLREWLRYAPKTGHVIGIDQNESDPAFVEWAKAAGVRYDYICGNTHADSTLTTLERMLDGRPIDFLFIDADHTETGVTRDFVTYGPYVRDGGIIALHDILDPHPSRNQDHIRVSRLWERIRRAGYVTRELVAHPDQDWGGIGVVSV